MKIYTRGGDRGETGLLGGDRVPKSDPRVEAYGSVDELNAALGLALALDSDGLLDRNALAAVQEDLFAVGAWLAAADPARARERGTIPDLPPSRVADLERWIDRLEEELPPLDAFVLPGGSPAGAQLHVARTVCRRAERAVVRLHGVPGGEGVPRAGAGPRAGDAPERGEREGQEEGGESGERGETGERPEDVVIPYLNRLSDLLFTLARSVNRRAGVPETEWVPRRRREGAR